jgi:transcriptional regulator with XRE-family HTH domain
MPSHLLSHSFGAVVRRRRIEAGLSQEGLAELAQVHATYIGLVERCKRNCSLDVANAVSQGLGVSLSVLIVEAEVHQKQVNRKISKRS